MIGPRLSHPEALRELADTERNGVADLGDAVARLRAPARSPSLPHSDLTNVVLFSRLPRGDARTEPQVPVAVTPADRLSAHLAVNRGKWLALLACSVAAHAALYLPFAGEPQPLASIGEQVISAEIVVGANEDAGLHRHGGTAEASAPDPARTPEPVVEQPKPIEPEQEMPRVETALLAPAEAMPVETPQPVQAEPAKAAAPDMVVQAAEPAEQPSVALQAPAMPAPEQPAAPAQIQAAPMEPVPTVPAELRASINPEPSTETRTAPPKEVTAVPERPKPPPKRKPVREAAKPKRPVERERSEARRATFAGAPNDSRSTGAPSTAAGGVGRGRSDNNSNYRGLVAAHLARYKQFPSDARSRGATGSATVSFSLSGSGSVTSVRLGRGTGIASLDAEATAMVRRASPFPAPPDGRPQSFTVPVSFRLN